VRRAGAAGDRHRLVDEPLAVARAVGATDTVNVASSDAPLPPVDVAVEASGSPAGLAACLEAVRRGGRVVLIGLQPPGAVPAPMNLVVTREIEVVGSFRFIGEYAEAVAALADGLDVGPLMSGIYPLDRAREAFELASDRRAATKVQLDLEAAR
jgi:L-idonate 5-dehydrogenase